MHSYKSSIEFGIVGLGRFGFALATTLCKAGKEVLVLDSSEQKIKQISQYTDNAMVASELTKETLEEAGIQNCDTVIVCIGEKIDVCILTTLNVLSMGVPRVIAKAISFEQGKVLEKIGAEVIYPEHDMALRLANRLMSSRLLDYIALSDDISISEFRLPERFHKKTVFESNLRRKFELNIIAIQHEGTTTTNITPDLLLYENDVIVVVGKQQDIDKFDHFLLKVR